MKTSRLTILILIIFSSFLFAGNGTSGAQFMQIGVGVRALSMGNSYVGLAEGIESLYWNPAGIAGMNTGAATFGHTTYFADMNFENIGFATPAFGGVVGISGIALLTGDIDVTTVENPDGTGETFTANDYAVGISYARQLTEKFSVGITAKYVTQNLADLSAQSWALDIGASYRIGVMNNMRIGFSILNFGPDMSYQGDDLLFRTKVFQDEDQQAEDSRAKLVTEQYQMPLTIQIGIAFDVFETDESKLVAVIDGINPNDQSETFGAGLEYGLMESYFVRGGYSDKNGKGLTMGLGMKVDLDATMSSQLDYGYEQHEYLGELHRFSVGFTF